MRKDCPSFIMLRASKCGQFLEVIDVCNEHNHEISETTSRYLPQNRKLPPDVKAEVLEMLMLHIDRKMIIEYIKIKTNKHVTLKDLFNLKASNKQNKLTSSRPKAEVLERLHNVCDTVIKEYNIPNQTVINDEYCSEQLTHPPLESSQVPNELLEEMYYEIIDDSMIEYNLPKPEISEEEIQLPAQTLTTSDTEEDQTEDIVTEDMINENIIEENQQQFEYEYFVADYPEDENSVTVTHCGQISEVSSAYEEHEPRYLLDQNTIIETEDNNEYVDHIDDTQYTDSIIETDIGENQGENQQEVCTASFSKTSDEPNHETNDAIKSIDDADSFSHGIVPLETQQRTDDSMIDDETHTKRNRIKTNAVKKVMHFNFTKTIRRDRNRRNKTKNQNCKHCGMNPQLVRMQMEVLEAEKQKLIEETHILRLTKEKLIAESNLRNT